MIDKKIAVGRLALTVSLYADKSFGQSGRIVSFNGMYVELSINGTIHRTTPSGIAIVCDTPEELSKLQICDDQTYQHIVQLKRARTDFIKNLQLSGIETL